MSFPHPVSTLSFHIQNMEYTQIFRPEWSKFINKGHFTAGIATFVIKNTLAFFNSTVLISLIARNISSVNPIIFSIKGFTMSGSIFPGRDPDFSLLHKWRSQGFLEKIRFQRYPDGFTDFLVNQHKGHFILIAFFNVGFSISTSSCGHNTVQKTSSNMAFSGFWYYWKLLVLYAFHAKRLHCRQSCLKPHGRGRATAPVKFQPGSNRS